MALQTHDSLAMFITRWGGRPTAHSLQEKELGLLPGIQWLKTLL